MIVKGNQDTISWYDNNAEKYASDTDSVTFEGTAQEFLSKLQPNPKVLDAGCGSGRDTATLSELGAEVIGIDLSSGLIQVAKAKKPHLTFVHGSFLDIPFPDNSFDGVWSHASLVHLDTLDEVKTALQEFNRVLKSGGCLYVLVKKQTGTDKTAVVTDSLSNHDRFFRYYTEDELAELLKITGYKLDSMLTEDDVHGRDEVKWIKIFAQKIVN